MKKNNKQRFNIDFFEFSFLVEACIPPVPIARSMFFDNVIDRYYHEMTPNERNNLFEWIQKISKFDTTNESCRLFYDRFNPENQYIVTCEIDGVKTEQIAFKHTPDKRNVVVFNTDGSKTELNDFTEERLYINKNKSINEKYIIDIKKQKIEINEY